jgi:hypothetical protein
MFDLSDRPLVWIPIKWTALKRPDDDPAGLAIEAEFTFDCEVEVLDRDELVKLFGDDLGLEREAGEARAGDQAGDNPPPTKRELEVARFLKVVKAWRKVKDGGRDLELNAENVGRVLARPAVVSAFETAYLAACAGKADIRRGN